MSVPFDPDARAALVKRAKKQIRARMKALRGGHPSSSLSARSERIVQRLLKLPELEQARGVAMFWPIDGRSEVDLRSLDGELRRRGLRLFYPFMDPREEGGYSTGFREVTELAELQERGRGFLEPRLDAARAQAGDVDVVIVPALAADARGHRLGYGAGYYDATLPDLCPPAASVIVVYQFQMMAELPVDQHDLACRFVVTDEASYVIAPR